MIYVDRWFQLHPKQAITYINVHRLIATSLLIAIKIEDDMDRRTNGFYARISGLTLKGNVQLSTPHFFWIYLY